MKKANVTPAFIEWQLGPVSYDFNSGLHYQEVIEVNTLKSLFSFPGYTADQAAKEALQIIDARKQHHMRAIEHAKLDALSNQQQKNLYLHTELTTAVRAIVALSRLTDIPVSAIAEAAGTMAKQNMRLMAMSYVGSASDL